MTTKQEVTAHSVEERLRFVYANDLRSMVQTIRTPHDASDQIDSDDADTLESIADWIDSRLISAAPEMLTALRGVVEAYDPVGARAAQEGDTFDWLRAVHAAIAKATAPTHESAVTP